MYQQLKKDLKHCSKAGYECDECTYAKQGISCDALTEDALKAIVELEQENSELQQETDAYRKTYMGFIIKLHDDKEFRTKFDSSNLGGRLKMFEDILDQNIEEEKK